MDSKKNKIVEKKRDRYEYNVNEKIDHIAYMFNVRTKRKAYENFIVNAIYTKVGNPELMPVTQQYVKKLSDPRKYYLLDLYFPQINYGVEVDERQHNQKDHEEADEKRAEDIISAIECDEGRIPIYDDIDKPRSYEAICKDIDSEVAKIKAKIDGLQNGLKWETNDQKIEKVRVRGYFDISDEVSYRNITQIYNLCGGRRTGLDKGKEVLALQKCYYRLTDEYRLWVPTLAIKFKDGTMTKARNGYLNFLSEDGTLITEQTKTAWEDPDKDSAYKRVVFMRMKDKFGRGCLKFIGVFESVTGSEDRHFVRYYKRIGTSISIDELKNF